MNDIDILEQQAIDAAIHQNWNDAINLNKKIIAIDKKSLDSFLRLGFAYLQLQLIKEAKDAYTKALKIQSKNQVAIDNMERIAILEDKETVMVTQQKGNLDPSLFLEVSGKTRAVSLVNLGQKNHLAQLRVGQEVQLMLKKRKVEVRTMIGDYVGTLPDDLSKRLIFFLKAKSKYEAYIQESALTRIVIFIKEVKKGKAVAQHISFPANIQVNMDQLSHSSSSEEPAGEAEDDSSDEGEIEHIANSLDREEEYNIEIPQEEEVEE